MLVEYFKYTDRGSRVINEDSVKVIINENKVIACIADGVGGEGAGEIASQKTIEFFTSSIENGADLKTSILDSHNYLKKLQKESSEYSQMATTLSCCVIENSILNGVHVGDSRICVLRGNGIKQLTTPHTEAYRLYQLGKLSFDEMKNYPRRHIIESAIGINSELQIQDFNFNLQPLDRILLTTDGVHEIITKTEFRDLSKQNQDVGKYGQAIISLLNSRKITDNTSFIVISILS